MSVEVIRARALEGVAHGFLTRSGGVSEGPYASLNCGIGSHDDPAKVAENRRRAAEAVVPGAQLVGLYQVHGADAVAVLDGFDPTVRPHADALVTNRPGIALGILTADCAPVLFADTAAGVVGAAHAGWKGAVGGITDSTLLTMETLGADRGRLVTAIGPCIAQANYEVDDAFRQRFAAEDDGSDRFFRDAGAGHAMFDLAGYVAHRLARAGVRRVEIVGADTYADDTRFFSYRRATHRAAGDAGRQISIIGLTGNE
ncbi:polyphenol oxidase [Sphingomonas sp. Leaf33]|uniref:peptidoglycan editing factor PgeF n=1 Tax=Sphingomonas sp. Leaf33 TaxID=1736215 RepID=UPI0006FDA061|nr:peptidoglycan editing factor PgeF [Sphingomonas sp. Leaf33]KQN25447.1 polyphenol oxidase [Sphingomonas sp. Leaf33]